MGNYNSKPNMYAKTMGLTPLPMARPRRPGTRYYAPPGGPTGQLALSGLSRLARKARSITKTVTKRKQKVGKRTRAGGRGQTTYFTEYMKAQRLPKQIYKQLVGHQAIADEAHNFALSTIGQQEAILFPIFRRQDLLDIKDQVTGITPKTAKIFMKSFTASLNLRNQTNQPCRMKIYDIVARRDSAGTTLDNPIECWNKGLQDLTGSVTDTYRIPFQNPNRSDEFKTWWKVLNVQTVELSGGDPHVHHVSIKCNKMLQTTAIDNGASEAVKGWTRYVMVVFIGSLSNSTQVNSEVTFCPIKIDWLWCSTVKFAYLEKNTATYTIQARPITTVTGALEAMADNGISNLTPTVN